MRPRTNLECFYLWVIVPVLAYCVVAFSIFQYNNPLANRMSFFRDFVAVMRFETLPQYQPKP